MGIKNLEPALFFSRREKWSCVGFNDREKNAHAQKQVMRREICIMSPKCGAIRMELPLYSAVVRVVRHCALLEHFLSQSCACKAGLRGIALRKTFFFYMKNGRVYAA